ncbi:DUF3613 domain-containing protein [Pararobbsia silviterrae]|uniref:DUF3613 domain-containing protein n=1 Tax=Pararobbsia silviterrae TaxID=1792498 RepID=A0A494XRW1_9BURK|nr:DUF3613 domain-containing protein [Pararobbsia silviterrae]RKP50263.1 DUF3613 domain-containing protein [Pararobbsia silviterrae]
MTSMMSLRAMVGACICLVAIEAHAWGNDTIVDPPVGTATEHALEIQRSGAQAGQPLSMSGDQASAAYARYLKSFSAPIPVTFSSSLKSDVGSTSNTSSNP